MELKDFGWAIRKLKEGRFLTREGWNGKDQYLFLKEPLPSDIGAPTLPYIMMSTVQGDLVPWLASQTDVLKEDWVIVGDDVDMRISR